jgi:NADPH:quinone reductase-like Zn-dependent oxidoreductase
VCAIEEKEDFLVDDNCIGGGGGLSEAVAVPWDAVLPLPDNVELDTGGMYAFLRRVQSRD